REDLYTQKVTCKDIVLAHLSEIDAHNQTLNVFLEVYREEALQKAEEIDEKIKHKTAGRLAGLVVGLKDVLAYENHGLQSGSAILQGFKSQFTATAVQRLLEEDAIIIGRQNCDEFAMGSSNESSAFGPTRNFADISRVPGGSSGASAVAVQANMCQISIGSDTGGSVRQPAAFCGVVGLKPTYGRISRWGLAAYGSSFDCIGPITKSVEDAALVLSVMAGPDDFDSTVSTIQAPGATIPSNPTKKWKIGYFKEAVENDGLADDVQAATKKIFAELQADGHEIIPFDFPLLKYLLPTYYILTTAEASSNLSRYDGVRYGYRTSEAGSLVDLYKKTRAEGFGKEVKKRIMLGTFVLSADYYDAYYTKAQKVRRLLKEQVDTILNQVDCIISPTTPTVAFPIGQKMEDALQMYLADIYTVQANVTSHPAISVPIGKNAEGLPIGIQFVGKAFDELTILEVAQKVEGSVKK
ncbi:MAG: Asp-tRNA(Asn)/Glu-tRNA(Gln) amidotransferase subunit GatA, partial [Spirosomataceae bacterium]